MASGPATYSGDPSSSDKDTVRFLLGDTDVDGNDALFSDAEIEWAVSFWQPLYGSDLLVAAQLAENAAAQYAQQASYSADGVSVTFGPIGDALRALAITLKNQYAMQAQSGVAPSGGGYMWGDGLIPGTRPFAMGMKMDDDPEAGQQDFGGEWPWPYWGAPGAPGESGP